MGADVNLADLDEGGRPSFAVRHATIVDHVIFPGKLRSGRRLFNLFREFIPDVFRFAEDRRCAECAVAAVKNLFQNYDRLPRKDDDPRQDYFQIQSASPQVILESLFHVPPTAEDCQAVEFWPVSIGQFMNVV